MRGGPWRGGQRTIASSAVAGRAVTAFGSGIGGYPQRTDRRQRGNLVGEARESGACPGILLQILRSAASDGGSGGDRAGATGGNGIARPDSGTGPEQLRDNPQLVVAPRTLLRLALIHFGAG